MICNDDNTLAMNDNHFFKVKWQRVHGLIISQHFGYCNSCLDNASRSYGKDNNASR